MNSWILSLLLVVFVSPCVVASVGITTKSVPNGTVKTAYSAAINASGGCAPYKWAIVSGALPAGVTAKVPSTTTSLNLAGTPTRAATYFFAVKVTSCGGGVSQVAYKVVIIQGTGSVFGITTKNVPNGTVKTAYSAAINASGGCAPYKWTIVSGALPAGVTANVPSTTTSLNLAGTPTRAGTYSFGAKVTGCAGHISQVAYKVVIQATANHVVDLNWKSSTSGKIVGFDAVTWKKINVSLIASTLYSDSTVANGTTHYYAATAVDMNARESRRTIAVKAVVP